MLKLEGKLMNGLHSLGINGEDMSTFLKLSSRGWEDTYALDIRHSSIMVSVRVTPYFKTISTLKNLP